MLRLDPGGIAANLPYETKVMPSTYTSLYFHIVFCTKNRQPVIAKQWRDRLHEYLGGTINGLQGISQGIGGTEDHVHLLVGLKPTHCLSDFMRELKKASSTWVKTELGVSEFGWQVGYAAFSVSPPARNSVKTYIANQEAHHHKRTYREELIEILEQAEVDYDANWLD